MAKRHTMPGESAEVAAPEAGASPKMTAPPPKPPPPRANAAVGAMARRPAKTKPASEPLIAFINNFPEESMIPLNLGGNRIFRISASAMDGFVVYKILSGGLQAK
jgi:hypothetical protein